MKTKSFVLKTLGLLVLAATVISCGKSGTNNTSTNSCASGQVRTGAGCLTSCGANMVIYANSCVSVSTVGGVYGGGAAVSCGTGMLQSQYGCLLQCGTNAVWYNNQCLPATSTTIGNPIGSIGNIGTIGQTNEICSAGCGTGNVRVSNGCLPQYSCSACYGYANGWCVIGVNASAYYGF